MSQKHHTGPLTQPKRQTYPKRLLFFDTETRPIPLDNTTSENRFILGAAIFIELGPDLRVKKRKLFRLYEPADFIAVMQEVGRKKKPVWVFAHNVKFDLEVLNLPEMLVEYGYEHDYPLHNGITFIWTVKRADYTYHFVDIANYAPMPLRSIGKDIGISKWDVDFNRADYVTLMEYCIVDVFITMKFILEFLQFIQEHNLGTMKYTLASQAFTGYRTSFMRNPPELHDNDMLHRLERLGYNGGRTECFSIGEHNTQMYYYVDQNSQYPAAMMSDCLPVAPLTYNPDPLPSMVEYHLRNNYLIARVRLRTDVPAFPVRYKNKLVFPVGEPETVLHHAELEYAYYNDLLLDVYEYAAYRRGPLFRDYVEELYGLKVRYTNEGRYSWRLISKLLLNSLYGKFGQSGHFTEYLGDFPDHENEVQYCYDANKGIRFTEIYWYGRLFRNYARGEAYYSAPIIAGAITSIARMSIFRYMMQAGLDNVFYMDTDSLITNGVGYSNLSDAIDDSKLGMLALEGMDNHLTIWGCKDYRFGNMIRHKGVPASAIETSSGIFEFDRFEGFQEYRNRGAKGSPLMIKTVKHRRGVYDKGIVRDDGRVIPYVFSGLQPVE